MTDTVQSVADLLTQRYPQELPPGRALSVVQTRMLAMGYRARPDDPIDPANRERLIQDVRAHYEEGL